MGTQKVSGKKIPLSKTFTHHCQNDRTCKCAKITMKCEKLFHLQDRRKKKTIERNVTRATSKSIGSFWNEKWADFQLNGSHAYSSSYFNICAGENGLYWYFDSIESCWMSYCWAKKIFSTIIHVWHQTSSTPRKNETKNIRPKFEPDKSARQNHSK